MIAAILTAFLCLAVTRGQTHQSRGEVFLRCLMMVVVPLVMTSVMVVFSA